jgi:4-hydroxy-3-methylbut-2-en-1-yl diphosphate reductase
MIASNPSLPLILAPTRFEFAVVNKALHAWLAAGRGTCQSCGMGETLAAAFCQQLEAAPPASLTLLGWGGGLAPELRAGAVVCAGSVLRAGQPALPCAVLPLANSRRGPILTAPRVLLTPEEKRQALASGALAVEMEAYPLAQWAQAQGIPFYHVRLILDTADDPIPDLDGGPGVLLQRFARHPGLLLEMARLGWRVQQLNPHLARLAVEIAATLTTCPYN